MDEELMLLVEYLRGSYGMYIGKKSFRSLNEFINGYRYCMQKRDKKEPKFFGIGFQYYVENIYGVADKHWSSIIFDAANSDSEAFDDFYRIIDKFFLMKEHEQDDFYQFLLHIKRNGKPSLRGIKIAMDIFFGKRENEYLLATPLLLAFKDYVVSQYGLKESCSWIDAISLNEKSDESAFNTFYALFDSFLST